MFMAAIAVPRGPSAANAVTHVRRVRGGDHLDRLETGVGHPVEQPLAGAEQDGNEIEHQLVDHARRERLAHGGGATRYVDPKLTRHRRRALEGSREAFGDEV